MGRLQELNQIYWKDLLEQIAKVLSYFSRYSPPEFRHLSYRGTNFCIPVPPGIGTTVWHLSQPLCHFENADADRTWTSWGVRKDGQQFSMLTPYALLCVLMSATLAPTWRIIFWTGSPWQFCATRSGKSVRNDCWHSWWWISIYSMHSKTSSQTALHSRRELE